MFTDKELSIYKPADFSQHEWDIEMIHFRDAMTMTHVCCECGIPCSTAYKLGDDSNQVVMDDNDIPKYCCFDCCPPERHRWMSEFIVWERSCYWRCLLCGALLWSEMGFVYCPSCGAGGAAIPKENQCTTTIEDIEEETGMLVDDNAYLDSEE